MMSDRMVLYYCGLTMFLIVGLFWQITAAMLHSESPLEHYMGTNLTWVNDTWCEVYWLGGWDYESFIGDIRVNGKSMGHILPYSKVWEGNCTERVKVEAYDRSVRSYVTISNETGAVI